MNILLSEKHLVTLFIALFTLSAVFLFWQNKRELDPNLGKSWWTLSFAAPENSQSLDFTLENYSDTTTFRYEVIASKKVLVTETIELKRGEKITITPSVTPSDTARTSIVVTLGKERKEIYR